MTSLTFFLIFIPLLTGILLIINLLFATHNPYQEKDSAFECGFHSFLGQNRTQFSISFFIFGLLFLLFDLEILLVYPFVVSASYNAIYGLIIMLIFFLLLTLGFAFELGKKALTIESKQIIQDIKRSMELYSLQSTVYIAGGAILSTFKPVIDWPDIDWPDIDLLDPEIVAVIIGGLIIIIITLGMFGALTTGRPEDVVPQQKVVPLPKKKEPNRSVIDLYCADINRPVINKTTVFIYASSATDPTGNGTWRNLFRNSLEDLQVRGTHRMASYTVRDPDGTQQLKHGVETVVTNQNIDAIKAYVASQGIATLAAQFGYEVRSNNLPLEKKPGAKAFHKFYKC